MYHVEDAELGPGHPMVGTYYVQEDVFGLESGSPRLSPTCQGTMHILPAPDNATHTYVQRMRHGHGHGTWEPMLHRIGHFPSWARAGDQVGE